MNTSEQKILFISKALDNLIGAEFGQEAAFLLVVCEPLTGQYMQTQLHTTSNMNSDLVDQLVGEVHQHRQGRKGVATAGDLTEEDADLSDVRPGNL